MERGALGGWHEGEPARTRHRILRRDARRRGAGTVSRELNFAANVASRRTNRTLRRVTRQDQRWVAANLEDGERRGRSKPVRVRRSRRARGHRRRRARRG